jgi:hypothetical protein
MTRPVRVIAGLLLAAWSVIPAAQESLPLPQSRPFLDDVRRNLARSQEEQRLFGYKERRTDLNLNPFGRLGTDGVRVVEVTPTADGATNRRLLERDGIPVPDAPVTRREVRMPRGRSIVDDVVEVVDVAIDRRDVLDGHSAIVLRFHARRDAKPRTREGRIARAFSGLIWIDEAAREVEQLEATSIDDVSLGYGILARLNEGSVVRVRRQQIEPNLWMPTSVRFTGDGRALLVRKLSIDFALDWFDYRRVR